MFCSPLKKFFQFPFEHIYIACGVNARTSSSEFNAPLIDRMGFRSVKPKLWLAQA